MSRRGRGRGRGGRGRASGWPVGTSAGALGFARSLLDDRSEPATAAVLLLSWDPAWKQIAPHGPPTRHEGEVRRCGSLNATFSKRHELLSRSGSFDAIALIHHVRSMQRGAALRQHPRAAHVMYSIEPPGWKPKLEPTHLASFTRKFDLALTYEAADRHTKAPYVKPHHGDEIFGPLLMPFEERNESALVAAIVGNCAQAGSFPRHALLEQLMKHVRVDSLGNCLHNTGSRRVPTPRVQETRALQRYKFVIAVENSVCPDYITEKVRWPSLATVTVPLGTLGAEPRCPSLRRLCAPIASAQSPSSSRRRETARASPTTRSTFPRARGSTRPTSTGAQLRAAHRHR